MATAQWPPISAVPSGAKPEPAVLDAFHLALLLDLARALSGALEYSSLPSIAVQRVRLLTGAVLVRLGEPSGQGSLSLVAESSAADASRAPASTSAPERAVLRTEAPVWIGTVGSARARFGGEPLLEAVARAGAWAVLPLVVEGHLSGVLALAFDGPRDFDEVSRAFLGEVASLCASALAHGSVFAREHARADASEDARADAESRRRRSERTSRDRTHLFERERFARARAEADTACALEFAEGMERSQRLTAALARAGSVPAALGAIAAHAPAALGALGFSLVWPTGYQGCATFLSLPAGPAGLEAGARLAPGGGWADQEALRCGAPCWLEARELALRFPATADVLASLGGETWVGVPVRDGTAEGVLAFVLARGDLSAIDRGRLTSLTAECALVLEERAGRSERPRGAALPGAEHVAEYEETGPRGPELHLLGAFTCERTTREALGAFRRHRPQVVRAWITSTDGDVPPRRSREEVFRA